MRAIVFAAPVAAAIWAAISYPVAAQSMCGPAAEVVGRLAAEFGEAPIFVGRHPEQPRRMTLTLNPDEGTWSVVIDDGTTACVTAHGIDGRAFEQLLGEGA